MSNPENLEAEIKEIESKYQTAMKTHDQESARRLQETLTEKKKLLDKKKQSQSSAISVYSSIPMPTGIVIMELEARIKYLKGELNVAIQNSDYDLAKRKQKILQTCEKELKKLKQSQKPELTIHQLELEVNQLEKELTDAIEIQNYIVAGQKQTELDAKKKELGEKKKKKNEMEAMKAKEATPNMHQLELEIQQLEKEVDDYSAQQKYNLAAEKQVQINAKRLQLAAIKPPEISSLHKESTQEEVLTWLRSDANLSKYASCFEKFNIDGYKFSNLTDRHLTNDFRIKDRDHIKIILDISNSLTKKEVVGDKKTPETKKELDPEQITLEISQLQKEMMAASDKLNFVLAEKKRKELEAKRLQLRSFLRIELPTGFSNDHKIVHILPNSTYGDLKFAGLKNASNVQPKPIIFSDYDLYCEKLDQVLDDKKICRIEDHKKNGEFFSIRLKKKRIITKQSSIGGRYKKKSTEIFENFFNTEKNQNNTFDQKEENEIKSLISRGFDVPQIANKMKKPVEVIESYLSSHRKDEQWEITNDAMKRNWKPSGRHIHLDLTSRFTVDGSCSVQRTVARVQQNGEDTPGTFYIKSTRQAKYFRIQVKRHAIYEFGDEIDLGDKTNPYNICKIDHEKQEYHLEMKNSKMKKVILSFANAKLFRKPAVNPYNALNDGNMSQIKEITFVGDSHTLGFEWKGTEVVKVIPGGQAEANGVEVGWIIIQINDEPAHDDTDSIQRAINQKNAYGLSTVIKFNASTREKPLIEGNIKKKSGQFTNNRYFRVYPDICIYFREESGERLGAIPLETITSVSGPKGSQFSLKIDMGDDEYFIMYLDAVTKEEAKKWVFTLQLGIDEVNPSGLKFRGRFWKNSSRMILNRRQLNPTGRPKVGDIVVIKENHSQFGNQKGEISADNGKDDFYVKFESGTHKINKNYFKSTKKDRHEHVFSSFNTLENKFYCEICHRLQLKNTYMSGCQRCKWNSCADCTKQRRKEQLESSGDIIYSGSLIKFSGDLKEPYPRLFVLGVNTLDYYNSGDMRDDPKSIDLVEIIDIQEGATTNNFNPRASTNPADAESTFTIVTNKARLSLKADSCSEKEMWISHLKSNARIQGSGQTVEDADLIKWMRKYVKIANRRWRLQTFPNCFIGSELVTLMVENKVAENRQQAVNMAENLRKKGALSHVTLNHAFRDDIFFYTFQSKKASHVSGDVKLHRQLHRKNLTSEGIGRPSRYSLPDFQGISGLRIFIASSFDLPWWTEKNDYLKLFDIVPALIDTELKQDILFLILDYCMVQNPKIPDYLVELEEELKKQKKQSEIKENLILEEKLNLEYVSKKKTKRGRIQGQDADALSVVLMRNSNFTEVNLKNNAIGDIGISRLAASLKRIKKLAVLNLVGNKISDTGAIAIAHALYDNTVIRSLDMRSNHDIQCTGWTSLSKAVFQNNTIQFFSTIPVYKIKQNDSTCTSVQLVGSSFRSGGSGNTEAFILGRLLQDNSTLDTLNLWWNNIKEIGLLGNALTENKTLTYIRFSGNEITDDGVHYISKGLKYNSSLKYLYLNQNKMGNVGASALASALENNRYLTELYLNHNQIGNNGAESIGKAISTNSTLIWLYLQHNKIGNEGAVAIANALVTNKALTALNLSSNCIGDIGGQEIHKHLQSNSVIQQLYLTRNALTHVSTELFEKLMDGEIEIYV